jgi:hypothetical protein
MPVNRTGPMSAATMPTALHRFGSPLLLALACAWLAVAALDITHAQQPQSQPAQKEESKATEFFGSIGRWLDESFAKMGSGFKDAKSGVDNFGREAGVAAKSTVDAARDAADSVSRLSNAKVIRGHQNCTVAANGAPDCIAAATAICKANGFQDGKSTDMTTAEECPAQVMLGRRAAEPGECKTVYFVTRALCQ